MGNVQATRTGKNFQIKEYEFCLDDLLGVGAFGRVYKGKDNNRDRPVAVKKVRIPNSDRLAVLVRQEATILGQVTRLRHPNLVRVFWFYSSEHNVYMIMEYCDAGELSQYVRDNGPLGEPTMSFFLHQIAAAMSSLHAIGVIHRDLKPPNILLKHHPRRERPFDKQLLVADFGLARHLNDGSLAASIVGTSMYTAPEVLTCMHYDFKADLWSIGIIVVECLTGRKPFANVREINNFFHAKNESTMVNRINGKCGDSLTSLVTSLIKIDPRERIEMNAFFEHEYFSDESGYFKTFLSMMNKDDYRLL